jgi:hypothetical protein
MKTYREVEVLVHAFLTSALDGGEWPTSQPGRLIPQEYPLDRNLDGPQSQYILPTKCAYVFFMVLRINSGSLLQ